MPSFLTVALHSVTIQVWTVVSSVAYRFQGVIIAALLASISLASQRHRYCLLQLARFLRSASAVSVASRSLFTTPLRGRMARL